MNRHINFHGKVRRYNHNLSYHNFFNGEIGQLRPVWLEDGVPGDTFQYHPEARIYFSPLVFPLLSALKARIDVFFVPNRLAWNEWESFITGGPDNNLSPSYPSIRNIYSSLTAAQKPAFSSHILGQIQNNQSILDNLGHPVSASWTSTDLTKDPYDLIPYYDYLYIYDEYYRDEEKETSVTGFGGIHRDVKEIWTLTGLPLPGTGLRLVSWSKDYFTTASLEQQRGGDIPLLTNPMWQIEGPDGFTSGGNPYISPSSGDTNQGDFLIADDGANEQEIQSVLTINGLRYLYSAANWLNNNVIGGTRYIEILRRRYKVVSSDARLQRPEMIGSISLPVNIDVVTQTSSTVDDGTSILALGDRAGKASVVGSGKTLTYSCEEFGWFIAILHVAPKPAYFQGIRFNLQREDKFDFWTPEFERVPQRPIRNNEIFANSTTLSPESGGTFGYTGQFNEYRFHNDEVHGDFTDTLLAWTTARKFSSLPSADSSSFLKVDDQSRLFADENSEYGHLFGLVNNVVVAKREISNREPQF